MRIDREVGSSDRSAQASACSSKGFRVSTESESGMLQVSLDKIGLLGANVVCSAVGGPLTCSRGLECVVWIHRLL